MKINLIALAFFLCILVSQAVMLGASAQGGSQFAINPITQYSALEGKMLNVPQTGVEPSTGIVSDQVQPVSQELLTESGAGQTVMGPGGSSSEGVNGAFLYLDSVPGDSTEKSHVNWIDVISFNYSIRKQAQAGVLGGGTGTGRTQFGDLIITKPLDKASPQLYLLNSNGKHISEARLEIIRGGNLVLRYRLSDVTIGAVEVTGETTGTVTEKVSLRYGKIEWSYSAMDPSGRTIGEIKTGWDLSANRAL